MKPLLACMCMCCGNLFYDVMDGLSFNAFCKICANKTEEEQNNIRRHRKKSKRDWH